MMVTKLSRIILMRRTMKRLYSDQEGTDIQ